MIGTDIVNVKRIAKMDIKDFCKKVFNEDEANYIISKKNPVYTAAGIFAAKEAYTVDGGELGEIEYENFNAAGAKIKVNGINIHPGAAKNKMKNAGKSIFLIWKFYNLQVS